MIWKGFKFGMLLQIAIGPMCLLVFQTSASYGFVMTIPLILSITLVDALFVTLSGLGVGAILDQEHIKKGMKVFGALVLILFGGEMLSGVFDVSLVPNIKLFSDVSGNNVFMEGLLLTASNPLTIVFWSGIFSTQVIENQYSRKQLQWFGCGCVLATIVFLSFIGILGTIISDFMNQKVIDMLNGLVGVVLICYGVKGLWESIVGKRKEEEKE